MPHPRQRRPPRYGPRARTLPLHGPRPNRNRLARSQNLPRASTPRPPASRRSPNRTLPKARRAPSQSRPPRYLPLPSRRHPSPRPRPPRQPGLHPRPLRPTGRHRPRSRTPLPPQPRQRPHPHHRKPTRHLVPARHETTPRQPRKRHRLLQDRIQHLRIHARNPILQPRTRPRKRHPPPLLPRPLRRRHRNYEHPRTSPPQHRLGRRRLRLHRRLQSIPPPGSRPLPQQARQLLLVQGSLHPPDRPPRIRQLRIPIRPTRHPV